MKRKILSMLLFAAACLPLRATQISNVQVDMLKGYFKEPAGASDTASFYMGRLTYTFAAEGKDSVFLDFTITTQDYLDTVEIVEKTGDLWHVRQNNAGDTLKTIFFRARLLNYVSGTYVATLSADTGMSGMWKTADSLVRLMSMKNRNLMLYANTNWVGFGTDDMTLSSTNGTWLVGWRCSDGPHGVRWPIGPAYGPAIYGAGDTMTLFCTESALGCTWDPDLAFRVGEAIGRESRAAGVYCNLGPMCDLVINPAWGRAFETMGEDPILNGNMVVGQIKGLQATRTIATPKHFVSYLQEAYRMGMLRVTVSERALRELFCVPFEMAIKQGGARALMTSYNKVRVPGFTTSDPTEINNNVERAATNRHLVHDIVRNDWGFDGIVMTDWEGAQTVVPSLYVYETDFDMSMPYGYGLDRADFNIRILRIWDSLPLIRKATRCMYGRLWAWGGSLLGDAEWIKTWPESVILSPEHKAVALEEARKSIVLVKNDSVGGVPVLPLDKSATFIVAVVGPFSAVGRWGGGGSSAVTPDTIVTPLQGIRNLCAGYPNVSVVTDYTAPGVSAAIVCVGVDNESEGADRPNFTLPSISGIDQNALVANVMARVPRTIVVYTGGSASCAGAWSNAPGIMVAFYGGRSQGQAIAEALFGDINPGGHLNVTFPNMANDLPSSFGASELRLLSADSAHGYFYFEKTGKTPLFWFGHGLSYTAFNYGSMWVYGPSTISAGDRIDVNIGVTNTGTRTGEDVVQLYVKPNDVNAAFPRRAKDLRAFRRILLGPGETKMVTLTLGPRDFSAYDADPVSKTGQWRVLPGSYTLIAGSTSNPAELVHGNGKCMMTSITVQ
ncbi:MAG: glycoside hydrolase family 3 C-terminal domain-containing protein [Chitinispirillaceae bacterium]|nr:glycoside hydrolase family 3 C-terminal domain-containing protein [Chitinispirillaceae bacterium]